MSVYLHAYEKNSLAGLVQFFFTVSVIKDSSAVLVNFVLIFLNHLFYFFLIFIWLLKYVGETYIWTW